MVSYNVIPGHFYIKAKELISVIELDWTVRRAEDPHVVSLFCAHECVCEALEDFSSVAFLSLFICFCLPLISVEATLHCHTPKEKTSPLPRNTDGTLTECLIWQRR